jgi:formylglycine-generating enzyme required for sulfatase activity
MARVFVIWDSTLRAAGATARALRGKPHRARGHEIDILGAEGDRAFGELEERIRGALTASEGLLAFIDRPNANVAWEVGLGLGLGRPVALAAEASQLPGWTRGTPFASMLTQGDASDMDVLLDVLDTMGSWASAGEPPEPGDATLLLCPNAGVGKVCRATIADELPALGAPLDDVTWPLPELPRRLEGVGRVVWVVPQARVDEDRHGVGTTVHALIAGYAAALGLPLGVFCPLRSAALADVVGRERGYSTVDDLISKLRAWERENKPIGARATRQRPEHLRRLFAGVVAEDHARAVPLLRDAQDAALQTVYVQLGVAGRHEGRPARLEEFIRARLASEGDAGRWLVTAPPGAGKTTLARHLAHTLAVAATEDDEAPLPVFLRLADLPPGADPLAVADEAFRLLRPSAGSAHAALARAAARRGRLWLLLDGLDEVGELPKAARWLKGLAGDPAWAQVVIVVLTREVGEDELKKAGALYKPVVVQPLDAGQQRQLVANLARAGLVDEAAASHAQASIRGGALPAGLATNPLLLTLLVLTAAQRAGRGERPRVHRATLLSDAVDYLLERRYGFDPDGRGHAGVRRPALVRRVLTALAVAWHETHRERWSEQELLDGLGAAMLEVRTADVPAGLEMDRAWPDGARDLRDELDRHAGVLGRFDGPRSEWGWLHRSLRELLVAQAVARWPAERRDGLWGRVTAADEALEKLDPWDIKRRQAEVERYKPWGEALGLLVGMLPADEAHQRLEQLAANVPAAAVRALVAAEGLAPWEHLALLLRCHPRKWYYPAWDNDDLDAVVELLRARGDAGEALWAAVAPERSTMELGVLWYALERLEDQVDPRRFFTACGRPQDGAPQLDIVTLDGDRLSFEMGSPDGVGYGNEHPRHRVTLRPFALSRTPVTVAQFRAFDAAWSGQPDHPVVFVDWFSARLFATWVGGRLPTEAEWECACRAGTSTRWSFGDDEARLGTYAWFEGEGGKQTHPVGQKPANPWGLHDMHGHVGEWCEDRWFRRYDGPTDNPVGPEAGGGRVIRGGSAWVDAGWCRSALRVGDRPGGRSGAVGLRVALP